ncbi:MAG: PTS sugar transporter subunit IIA [Gammaproteobacteria bacterium]|nr:PTS sugar transporter subunit IIA [Gammaproteobacteria bacterium]
MSSPALDTLSRFSGQNPMLLDYLHVNRIEIDLDVTSRKRLFEEIADIASRNHSPGEAQLMLPLTSECVCETLNQRERLGSTGIGHGIMLPHGRIKDLPEPIISVVRLKSPIEYDVPDQVQIWLAVCLLVPENANEAHLNLLAELAALLNNAEFVSALKETETSFEIMRLFSSA